MTHAQCCCLQDQTASTGTGCDKPFDCCDKPWGLLSVAASCRLLSHHASNKELTRISIVHLPHLQPPWHVCQGHCVTPQMGQGCNSALEDCSLLTQCLEAAGHDIQQGLARYEATRAPQVSEPYHSGPQQLGSTWVLVFTFNALLTKDASGVTSGTITCQHMCVMYSLVQPVLCAWAGAEVLKALTGLISRSVHQQCLPHVA